MNMKINSRFWIDCLLDEAKKKQEQKEVKKVSVCPECGDKLWPQGGCFVCLLCGYESCS